MRFSGFSFVAGVSLVFFAAGCAGSGADSFGASRRADAEVPDFSLPNLKGETVNLGSLLKENKAVLINFWASWCPPCREEIPDLVGLQTKYAARGFTVLGVDVGESPSKVENFARRFGINYPVVLDREESVASAYRIVGIPTSYLVDSRGGIIGKYHAYTRELVQDIEQALGK